MAAHRLANRKYSTMCIMRLYLLLICLLSFDDSKEHNPSELFSYQIQLIPTIVYGPSPLHRQSLTEEVYTLMNSSMQSSIQQVQLTQSKIEVLYSQVHNQIMRSHQNSNDIFDKILGDYTELFRTDTNEVHPCVHMQQMRDITSYGRNNALKCVDSAIKQISGIQDRISPYSKSITSSIQIINEINNEQSKLSSLHPIRIGICVVEHVETVANAVAMINHDLKESSRFVTIETMTIEQNFQKCIERAIISIRRAVEDIVSDGKKCVGKSLE